MSLLHLALACVSIVFLVLQFGFGADSTQTVEIGLFPKVVGLFVYAPVAFAIHYFVLSRSIGRPNSDGSRLRLKYPKHWRAVGAVSAVVLIGATVTLGAEICAMLAPRFGGNEGYLLARVQALRDSSDVFGGSGLHVNCSRYIYLDLDKSKSERLCWTRRRSGRSLSAISPVAGQHLMLRTRSNALATFVESAVLVGESHSSPD